MFFFSFLSARRDQYRSSAAQAKLGHRDTLKVSLYFEDQKAVIIGELM